MIATAAELTTLAILDTVEYGYEIAAEEKELTRETRSLLTEICESVSDIVPDFEGDMGDFAADLEEML